MFYSTNSFDCARLVIVLFPKQYYILSFFCSVFFLSRIFDHHRIIIWQQKLSRWGWSYIKSFFLSFLSTGGWCEKYSKKGWFINNDDIDGDIVSLCSNFIALFIKPSTQIREFEKRSVIVMMMMLFKSVPWFRQNRWCRSAPRGTQNAIPKSWSQTPKCNPLGLAQNDAVPCCYCSFPGNQWWTPSRLSGSIQFGVIQFCYDASRWFCSYPQIESWWSRAQWPAEVEAEALLAKKLLLCYYLS